MSLALFIYRFWKHRTLHLFICVMALMRGIPDYVLNFCIGAIYNQICPNFALILPKSNQIFPNLISLNNKTFTTGCGCILNSYSTVRFSCDLFYFLFIFYTTLALSEFQTSTSRLTKAWSNSK